MAKEKKSSTQKEKKKHPIRKIVILCLCIICFLGGSCIYGYARIHPLYVKAQGIMYDILSQMNDGTFKRESNTFVYDKNNKLIGKIGYENYRYTDISKISPYIQNGYIAQEDKRFKTHRGVDWRATMRAAVALVKNHGKITQGGSTITQQVVKNNLLSQERTYDRKVLEILLALQIEKEYTKADIMEYYCNSNYYGNSCYGVEGASRYYFGKSAENVDLAEAAMLVGTSNVPNAYNPVADYDTCMKKKKQVLSNMKEQGYITAKQYKQAVKEKPDIKRQEEKTSIENYMTTYAVHYAALKLMEHEEFDFQYTFTSEKAYKKYTKKYNATYDNATQDIRNGGYYIYTSFDQKVQKKLQKSIDQTLKHETRKRNGKYDMQSAAVCIDNKTGLTIAAVGGRGTKDAYNRSYQAKRQPGSSIKPLLVYAPAVNEGEITPATVYNDHKVTISGYTPSNSGGSYHGNVTIRESLARSLNTVAVQVLHNNGMKTSIDYLGKLKFSTLAFADSNNLATALGGFTNGITVDDMARGYAALENGGRMRDSGCIRSLKSESDGVIYQYKKTGTKIYSKDTAFIMSDMMQGTFNESYGTAHRYKNKKQIYAGKTGTTNSSKDAWFAGYSKYYTTVTWVGCDMPRTISGLYGNGYPLQIWSSFMNEMHKDLPKADFTMPDTILLQKGSIDKRPAYTKNFWKSRPKGWDYISGELKQKAEEKARQHRIKNECSAAETAVSNFESFQITSTAEAKEIGDRYYDCLDVISEIEDDSKQTPYKERAGYKYSLLSGDVEDTWKDVMKEEKKQKAKERDLYNKEQAEASSQQALSIIKSTRINTVEEYISAIQNRQIYTKTVEELYLNASSALESCKNYDEYDSLKSRLNSAIEQARKLPTEKELKKQQAEAEKQRQKAEQETQENTDPDINTDNENTDEETEN